MSDTIKISRDIFIERASTETEVEYQVYSVQEDGWYDINGKRKNEKAIANNGFAEDSLYRAEERFQSYLSIEGREALIIKRIITTIIDPDSPLLRNIQMTETVIKRNKS